MGIKQAVQRLRTSTEELDRSKRAARRADLGATPTDAVADRQLVELVGEVQSMRIVPRAGTPTLEVVIDDGHGLAAAVFYGRRSIAGLHAGRAVRVSGRASLRTGRPSLINPAYELLD
ncbi:MAG: OB-fold nucleic acid binding domain-containing protein [Acidimicrobiales bacterium]|nr:OB-fold nucleic acid binding domain-containing protein [Acidimicrobiales bacterium]